MGFKAGIATGLVIVLIGLIVGRATDSIGHAALVVFTLTSAVILFRVAEYFAEML